MNHFRVFDMLLRKFIGGIYTNRQRAENRAAALNIEHGEIHRFEARAFLADEQ